MMKMKLASAIALAGLMQSSTLLALGLGDIDVSSAINERLDAEIPLTNTRGLDGSQILVALASKAEFARAGVDRDYFLTNLDFNVERGSNGPVLKVTTPDVVLEPYLNFLVEVRWPQGRLLREYTVLLDLPTYSVAPVPLAKTVTPPPSARADGSGASARSDSRPSRAARPAPSSSGPTGQLQSPPAPSVSQDSVTVQANDTLWEIALDVKPATVSVHQTMMALQAYNPDAFINNNINLLKKGAVLRVPTAQEIADIDARSARASVGEQQASWRSSSDTPQAPALDARPASVRQNSNASNVDGVLQLATSDSQNTAAVSAAGTGTSSYAGQNGEQLSAEVTRLRNELAVSLENLDRASVENATMDTRLTEMESQLSDLEQLVSLKDQELQSMRIALEARRAALEESQAAEAQAEAEAIAAASSAAVEESLAAEAAGNEAPAVVDEPAANEAPAASDEPAVNEVLAADEQAVAAEDTTATAADAAAEQPGFFAALAERLSLSVEALLGLGVGLIAIVVGLFMWGVGRRQESYEATVFEPVSEPLAPFDNAVNDTADAELEQAEDIAESEQVNGAVVEAEAPAEQYEEEQDVVAQQDDISDEVETGQQGEEAAVAAAPGDAEQDPIAEADIYLAYGRHSQAQQMLETAIDREPGRTDLRLKLLEVFVDQDSPEQFKATCEALLAIDPGANADAEALLGGVDDASRWWPQGSVAAPADEFLESYTEGSEVTDADLGLELDLDTDTDAPAADAITEADVEAEKDFSLQLAYDADTAEADAQQEEQAEAGQEDEVGTKLDLARAYIDMGDIEGAREILDEVLKEGDSAQRDEATTMMERIA